MDSASDPRSALIGLVDEVTRLGGRLKSTFAAARRTAGLNESEMMVLNAVVEGNRAPTVAQIGRSMGQPRQLVQRAANSLVEAGLIRTAANPDHKRAVLLHATEAGLALKRDADTRAEAIAEELTLDVEATRAATIAVRAIRKQLEARLRGEDIA